MAISLSFSGKDVNFDDVRLSDKILSMTLVVLCTFPNILFAIVKLARHGVQALKQPRHTITLSMAVGGIVHGMFAGIVYAVSRFEHIYLCSTATVAGVYRSEFLPVMYSSALIILGLDIVKRSKTISSTADHHPLPNTFSSLVSVLCAAIPWIVALVIVCPLALTEVDWKVSFFECFSEQTETQVKARLIVCGVVPECLAFVITIICILLSRNTSKNAYDISTPMTVYSHNQHNTTTTTTTTSPTDMGHTNEIDTSVLSFPDGNPEAQIPASGVIVNDNQLDNASILAHQEKDYEQNTIRKERMAICACSFIGFITVLPYKCLWLYVMENFEREIRLSGDIEYPLDKDLFLPVYVLYYFSSLFPVFVPLVYVVV